MHSIGLLETISYHKYIFRMAKPKLVSLFVLCPNRGLDGSLILALGDRIFETLLQGSSPFPLVPPSLVIIWSFLVPLGPALSLTARVFSVHRPTRCFSHPVSPPPLPPAQPSAGEAETAPGCFPLLRRPKFTSQGFSLCFCGTQTRLRICLSWG